LDTKFWGPPRCPLWVISTHLRCKSDVRFRPESDIRSARGHVCFTPKADMCDALGHVSYGPIADTHAATVVLVLGLVLGLAYLLMPFH
jgi:hypothetical protein